ncbi:hypothetical protein HDU98_009211 [Podochytrium sp. JEL0797]|nr:hypothetical protein HDU98_009211 [Podochytrium sp. JEL0797]
MIGLEAAHVASVKHAKETTEMVKHVEEQCRVQVEVIEEMELRIGVVQNELRISNEMLDRSRNEYKLLNETFAKVTESNQKNISHLKASLGFGETSSTGVHARSASSLATQNLQSVQERTNFESNNLIRRLEAELEFYKDRYDTDITAFKKLNHQLQEQLSRAISNYESLVADGRTEEDWAAIQRTIKILELKNKEATHKKSNAVDTLEITAHKYTLLSENYEHLRMDMKRERDNSVRLKSIVTAKDAIIDDMHTKTEQILDENESLKSRLKTATTTATVKANLAQDIKLKLDAVLSKVDPIQKEAAQSQSLQYTNKRLVADLKNKEIQLHEWKRKFNEMEAVLNQLNASVETNQQTQHQQIQVKNAQRIQKLQKSLDVSEQQVARLETAIRKSMSELFQNRERRQRGVDEFGICGGLKGGESSVISPDLAVKMSRLSKEFFGVGLYDVMKGSMPSQEHFSNQVKEA